MNYTTECFVKSETIYPSKEIEVSFEATREWSIEIEKSKWFVLCQEENKGSRKALLVKDLTVYGAVKQGGELEGVRDDLVQAKINKCRVRLSIKDVIKDAVVDKGETGRNSSEDGAESLKLTIGSDDFKVTKIELV